MTLMKTIASYRKTDGTWEPQKHVAMEPAEEKMILAKWAVGDSIKNMPIPPNKEMEHDWLIEHGIDFVKQKRAEWNAAHESWKITHMPLEEEFARCCEAYHLECQEIEMRKMQSADKEI